jgi:hypothetical protein
MAVKYIKDGGDFEFPESFGFKGSAPQPKGFAEGGKVDGNASVKRYRGAATLDGKRTSMSRVNDDDSDYEGDMNGEEVPLPPEPKDWREENTPHLNESGMLDAGKAHGGAIKRAAGGPAIPGRKPKAMGQVNPNSPDFHAGLATGLRHGARIGAQAAATHLLGGNKGAPGGGAPSPGPGLGAGPGAGPMAAPAPDVGGGGPPIPGQQAQPGALGMADGGHVDYEGSDYAKGGKFIQGAIKHPGALHENLGIAPDRKIPASRLEAATHSRNPTIRREANLAETMKGFHHKRKD